MFDYFPGYNKFRSVTFALYFPLFSMPLLGSLGLQNLTEKENSKELRKKILIALISTAGLCALVFILAGMASFTKDGELQLPQWFLSALRDDRQGLMRADALRSLAFIVAASIGVYLAITKTLKWNALFILLTFLVTIDLYTVSKRYLSEDNFVRSSQAGITATEADRAILQDPADYRVFNIAGDAFFEARTSYYHQSVGGYHGAKLRRYQELYELQVNPELSELISSLQAGNNDFGQIGVINMLNVKYLKYGDTQSQVIANPEANGSAWMVSEVQMAGSADEEIQIVGEIDTKSTAVVDESKFPGISQSYDSGGSASLEEKQPNYLKYRVQANGKSLVIFSEIFYPVGWTATIDGENAEIIRANYVLRALEVPSGNHEVEFRFEPASYHTGNTIVLASNIILGLLILFSLYRTFKSEES